MRGECVLGRKPWKRPLGGKSRRDWEGLGSLPGWKTRPSLPVLPGGSPPLGSLGSPHTVHNQRPGPGCVAVSGWAADWGKAGNGELPLGFVPPACPGAVVCLSAWPVSTASCPIPAAQADKVCSTAPFPARPGRRSNRHRPSLGQTRVNTAGCSYLKCRFEPCTLCSQFLVRSMQLRFADRLRVATEQEKHFLHCATRDGVARSAATLGIVVARRLTGTDRPCPSVIYCVRVLHFADCGICVVYSMVPATLQGCCLSTAPATETGRKEEVQSFRNGMDVCH